jgi:hypothetical protein
MVRAFLETPGDPTLTKIRTTVDEQFIWIPYVLYPRSPSLAAAT